jgi:alcohol dehydrogenase (NADP+)/uncharacterized zinc-type alcohol dehydrogenase-like protein
MRTEISPYRLCKTAWHFTQAGSSINGEPAINNTNMIFNRVNFNGLLIGGIAETQEVVNYCAENKIYPQIHQRGRN